MAGFNVPFTRLRNGKIAEWQAVFLFILLAVVFSLQSLVFAPTAQAVSQYINVQGKVTNSNGTNVANGLYDFTLKLYTGADSGATNTFTESWTNASLWTSTMSSAPASSGTSLTYSSNTNESSIKAGQILWNTTKQEAVRVISVNTGTNVVTISATAQAWNTTDTVTNRIYVRDGIFQVSLNSLNANWGTTDFNQDNIHLGVNFNADGEMKPRSQLNSVAYAFRAQSAASVDGLTIASGKSVVFNNSITFNGTDSTTFSLPSASTTLVGTDSVQVLTNKTITTSGLLTAGAGFTLSSGALSLPSNSVTDAMVSNTLTSSIFIGSGSTTNAVDLATAEVAGILPSASLSGTYSSALTFSSASNSYSGTWNGTALTDAQVSDTLTSSLFVGSGSTTTAIDLATAEVAGTLSIARGGTNSTATPTNGGIAYGTGSAFAFTAAGTSNQCLLSNGAAAPTWGSCSTGSITGSGVAGQVSFWDGTSSQTGDSEFIWDNTNKRLGVGGTPTTTFEVIDGSRSLRYGDANGLQVVTTGNTAWVNIGTHLSGVPILRWYDSSNVAMGGVDGSGNLATFSTATITSAGLLTASNGFTLSSGALSLPASSVTDAMVSDTLTASLFVGSGSTTTAIDLATAEVAGTLSIARGGTNSTATPTNGGVAYGTGSAFAFTAAGTSNQCLLSSGAAAPTWGTCPTTIAADSLDYDDFIDAMTLDASTSIATAHNTGLSVTSSLTGGARSTAAFSVTQANNVTNNFTNNLIEFSNSDTASSGTVLAITNSGTGNALAITGTTMSTGKVSINNSGLGSNSLDVYTSSAGGVAAFQTNGITSGQTAVTITIGNAVTGNFEGLRVTGSATDQAYLAVYNTGAGQAVLRALTTGAGDAQSTYEISGGIAWATGVDNSDGDKFKISNSTALGTTDRLTIDSSGNVGIGDTTPETLLNLSSSGTLRIGTQAASQNEVSMTGGNLVHTYNITDSRFGLFSNGTVELGLPAGNDGGALRLGSSANYSYISGGGSGTGRLNFYTGGDTTNSRLHISSSGDVGLGTTSPNDTLDVRGQGTFGVSSAVGFGAALATSGLEVNVSSNSLVTIGESGAGNANPQIVLYRTSAGSRSGRAARIYSPNSAGTLQFDIGSTSTTYGSETYTNLMTLAASGANISTGLDVAGGFTMSGGSLSLPSNAVTDAMVSNTLTSSIFIGSGSTTNAVDLATAEVAGTLSIARGGTNSTATPTNGGIAYGTGSAFAFTAAGSSGQCLQSNGAAAPTWGTCTTIGADSLDFTEFADALTLDASTSIALGSNTLSTSGTGSVSFGHTGNTSFNGALYYGTAPMNIELTRTLPTVVDDYVEIGSLALSNGAHNVRLTTTVAASGFSVSKQYLIPIKYDQTGAATWHRAVPIADSGAWGAQNFEVDVMVATNTATFRLRRTGGVIAATASVRLETVGFSTDAFTALTGTGSTTAPSSTLSSTLITQNAASNLVSTTTALTVAGTLTASNGLTLTTGTLSLPSNSVTDAMVSNTLTSSIFIGSGSTTNAVDLATAEVAGILPSASLSGTYSSALTFSSASNSYSGTWNGTALTDAQVSDTLTSSLFVGSGSTTSAIDLSTAEVAGTLSIARGGTNSTATPTNGGIAYGTGSAFAFTAAGTSNQCLLSNGAAAPTWGVCTNTDATIQKYTKSFNVTGTTDAVGDYWDLWTINKSEPSSVYDIDVNVTGAGIGATRRYQVDTSYNSDIDGAGNTWRRITPISSSNRPASSPDHDIEILVKVNAAVVDFRAALVTLPTGASAASNYTVKVTLAEPLGYGFSGTVTENATSGTAMSIPTAYVPIRLAGTGGFVGIGDESPTNTLDVSGTFRATGAVTLSSTATVSGLLTASNGFTLSTGTLSLPSNSVTDAMVSNTLTSSIFIGSGSTTNAVDLATAEVAGTLANSNLTGSGALTVTAGNGLTGGGSVALGGSTSLTVGAGTGITVGATTVGISNTTVSAASYGSASSVSTFTVNAQGQLTAASSTAISINASAISAGTLAIARGGTNSTATPTNGGIAYGTGSAFAFTAAGTSNQCLLSNGAAAPTWGSCGGITGSGSSGQVSFWNGTSSQTGDSTFIWDNTNKRLGVGGSPGYLVHVQKTFTSGTDERGLSVNVNQSTAGVATLYGQWLEPTFTGTSGTLQGVAGLQLRTRATGSGGTVNFMDGIAVWPGVLTGATAGTVRGITYLDPEGTGTVTSQAGIAIGSLTRASNNTGLLLGTTTPPSGNYALYSASTEDSYFAGQVGIGQTSPAGGTLLDIDGGAVNSYLQIKVKASGSTAGGSGINLYNNTESSRFYFGINNTGGGSTANMGFVWMANNYGLRFGTNNTQRMLIEDDGDILIGSGTTASTLLHITGSSTTAKLRLESSGAGGTALSQTMPGVELLANGMNTTSKYTPAIKFGSTDPEFTTTNPKFLAGIAGYATDTYAADTNGGMGLSFFVSANSPGASPVPVEIMTLTSTTLSVNSGSGTNSFVLRDATFSKTSGTGLQLDTGINVGSNRIDANVFAATTSGTGATGIFDNTGTSGVPFYIFSTNSSSASGGGKFVINDANSTNNGVLTITNTDRIGINNDTPAATLDIQGDLRIGDGAVDWRIFTQNNKVTPNECDTASTGGASIEVLCFNSTDDAATEVQFDHNGSGAMDGTLFQNSDPDVAEYFPVNDQSIYSGDILTTTNPAGMNDDNQYRNVLLGKSSEPYQSSVVGVVSSGTPFLVGMDKPFKVWGLLDKIVYDNQRATTLAGRIPVKVSNINGPIMAGDAITTSIVPGYGMKATAAGSIVGKALQSFDGTAGEHAQLIPCPSGTPSGVTCAKIMVLLNISWQNPAAGVDEEPGLDNAVITSAFTISQNLLTVEMDMKVMGSLTANGALTVNGPAEFNGPAVFKAMAEFIDRVIFNKDVEFRGRAVFNSDSGGFAQLTAGETEVTIAFDQEYADQPIISASPSIDKLDQAAFDGQVLAATCETTDTLEQCQAKVEDNLLGNMPTYVVTKKSTTSFTIKLSQPATQDLKFSWSAIAVKDAKTASN